MNATDRATRICSARKVRRLSLVLGSRIRKKNPVNSDPTIATKNAMMMSLTIMRMAAQVVTAS